MTDPKPVPAIEIFMKYQAEINRVASLRAQCVKRYERLKAGGMEKGLKDFATVLDAAQNDLHNKRLAVKDAMQKVAELHELFNLHREYRELLHTTKEAEKALETGLQGYSFVETGATPAPPPPVPEPQAGQKRPLTDEEQRIHKRHKIRVAASARLRNPSRAELRKMATEEDAEQPEHDDASDEARAQESAAAAAGGADDSDEGDLIPVTFPSPSSSLSSSAVGVLPPPASSSSAAAKPRTEQSAVEALAHLAGKK